MFVPASKIDSPKIFHANEYRECLSDYEYKRQVERRVKKFYNNFPKSISDKKIEYVVQLHVLFLNNEKFLNKASLKYDISI